ncbi:MAG TPA: type II secretion system protein [Ideonella sp.]|uniref:type II secretion system protein n=1 Tax=Ideonella sp. TaxID=1929293 RepID=UPI002CD94DA8|nr:type II secretion system protein [Ideonella sp.]HSI48013.1 type II secretion system protein [Ideonella sp.]
MVKFQSHGFTILELVAVVAILGILATMAMPLVEVNRRREQEKEYRRAVWEIRDAIDAYKKSVEAGEISAGGSNYPPSLSTLVDGAVDVRNSGKIRRYLRRIPRDPFAPENLSAATSWGLRSYASPPDVPVPGADVYDVYTRYGKVGLDGTSIKDW